MPKQAVKVHVRLRPTASFTRLLKCVVQFLKLGGKEEKVSWQPNLHSREKEDGRTIEVTPKRREENSSSGSVESLSFKFDGVLHTSGQEFTYNTCAKDVVESVIDGYNGTILA